MLQGLKADPGLVDKYMLAAYYVTTGLLCSIKRYLLVARGREHARVRALCVRPSVSLSMSTRTDTHEHTIKKCYERG